MFSSSGYLAALLGISSGPTSNNKPAATMRGGNIRVSSFYWSFIVVVVVGAGAVLLPTAFACPQNLGSCKCFPSSVPGAKPVLDCSLIVRPSEFQNVEGLKPGFAGGPPIFAQIIIRRSQLKEIPQNAFGIAQADEYIIENNPALETMERNAFGKNANPKIISIRNNPLLEVIQYEDFAQYTNLEIIRLNDNRILEVPDYAFDGVSRKLREIHLERNIILDIGPFAFRGLPSLKLLNLAENQIGEIPTAALFFSAPPDLVDLSRNKIATIDGEAFSDPAFPNRGSYAKHVDLSNNEISSFERAEWETIFNQIDRLEKLGAPIATTLPPPPSIMPIETTTTMQFFSPLFSTPAPIGTFPTTTTIAPPPPPPPLPAAPVAPFPAPVAPAVLAPVLAPAAPAAPNTENLLLKILERLQVLTGGNNQQQQQQAQPTPASTTLPPPPPPPPSSTSAPALPPQIFQQQQFAPMPIARALNFPAQQPAAQQLVPAAEPVKIQQHTAPMPMMTPMQQVQQVTPQAVAPSIPQRLMPVQMAAPQPVQPPQQFAPVVQPPQQFAPVAQPHQQSVPVAQPPQQSAPVVQPPQQVVQIQQIAPQPVATQTLPPAPAAQPPPPPVPMELPAVPAPKPVQMVQTQPEPSPIPFEPQSTNEVPMTPIEVSEAPLAPAPAPAPAPAAAPAEPAAAVPASVAALTAFGPFLKIREELLAAIKTNPAAAVAAASAVQAAAQAAAQAVGPVEPTPAVEGTGTGAGPSQVLVRRKRQSLLNAERLPPAKSYTIDFTGNPLMCDCEAKWVFDLKHRYEDQLLNLNCLETRESIFKLHFGHFRSC